MAEVEVLENVNPFLVFPEEIWEMVLEKCENSEEISVLLKAIPELGILTWGKQFSWQFSKILPLVFPKYIGFQDAKTCRHVSKRWKNAVDKSLETHSDLLPYNPTKNTRDKISETHFNYRRLPSITTNIFPFLWFEFNETENETWAVSNVNPARPSTTSAKTVCPFPGRSVSITLNHVYAKMEVDKKFWTYSERCRSIPFRVRIGENPRWQILSTLRSVGHHIYYVNFKLPSMSYWKKELPITELMLCLVLCLSYLPNLKSLKLEGFALENADVSEEVSRNIIAALKESKIPAHVETLDLWDFGGTVISRELFNSFLTLFVNHNQVKKLTMYTRHWNKQLSSLLHNLTELCLDCYSPSKEFSLRGILKGLVSFPCLRKLCIRGLEINAMEIVQLIANQNIVSLELCAERLAELPTKENAGIRKSFVSKFSRMLRAEEDAASLNLFAPTIRSLKFNIVPYMNLAFLGMLPCLQFLSVSIDEDNYFHFHHVDVPPGDIVSSCVFTICDNDVDDLDNLRNIWEAFPTLKMISVESPQGLNKCVREDPASIYVSRW